jgi:hypothetical protein
MKVRQLFEDEEDWKARYERYLSIKKSLEEKIANQEKRLQVEKNLGRRQGIQTRIKHLQHDLQTRTDFYEKLKKDNESK